MLKMYLGKDDSVMQTELQKVLSDYKEQGLQIHRIDRENYYSGILTEVAETVSLFEDLPVYVLMYPTDTAEYGEEFFKNITTLEHSHYQFLAVERSLTAAQKKQCGKTEFVTINEGVKKDTFDVFACAKHLAQKNKKELWIQFQDAQKRSLAVEPIIGMLWWQLKVIKLTYLTSSATSAGVSEFVYKNAVRAKTVWPEVLLDEKMQSLLTVYHEGHGGVRNINEGLEKWILTL